VVYVSDEVAQARFGLLLRDLENSVKAGAEDLPDAVVAQIKATAEGIKGSYIHKLILAQGVRLAIEEIDSIGDLFFLTQALPDGFDDYGAPF
jgi:hypothetical protein